MVIKLSVKFFKNIENDMTVTTEVKIQSHKYNSGECGIHSFDFYSIN